MVRGILKEPRCGGRAWGCTLLLCAPIVSIAVAFDQQPGQGWLLDVGFATVSTIYAGQTQD